MPSLSEAEEVYNAMPGGAADVSHLRAERQRSRMRLGSIARLEQVHDLPPIMALPQQSAVPDMLTRGDGNVLSFVRLQMKGQCTSKERLSWQMLPPQQQGLR